MRDDVVDVADEAQRDVIVLGIDPARARQTAAQHGERLAHVGGNFETGEEAGHGERLQGWTLHIGQVAEIRTPLVMLT